MAGQSSVRAAAEAKARAAEAARQADARCRTERATVARERFQLEVVVTRYEARPGVVQYRWDGLEDYSQYHDSAWGFSTHRDALRAAEDYWGTLHLFHGEDSSAMYTGTPEVE